MQNLKNIQKQIRSSQIRNSICSPEVRTALALYAKGVGTGVGLGIGQSPPSHKHSALLQLLSHIPSSIQPKLHVQSTYLCAAGREQQSTSSERNTGRYIHDLTMGEGCVSAIAGRAGSWPRAVLTRSWLRFLSVSTFV